jgi:hypothetical protein
MADDLRGTSGIGRVAARMPARGGKRLAFCMRRAVGRSGWGAVGRGASELARHERRRQSGYSITTTTKVVSSERSGRRRALGANSYDGNEETEGLRCTHVYSWIHTDSLITHGFAVSDRAGSERDCAAAPASALSGDLKVAKVTSLRRLSRISSFSTFVGGFDHDASSCVNGVNAMNAFLDVTRETSR